MVIRAFSPPRQKAVARTIRRRSGQRAYQLSSDRANSQRPIVYNALSTHRASVSLTLSVWFQMAQGGDEARELNPHSRLRLDQIEIDAARGCEEARRAIGEGAHLALLQRAQLLEADIFIATTDRWTEDALVQFSTSSLTALHDKSPVEFFSKGLGRVGSHLKWSAGQFFSGLRATVKLCGLRLHRPCPPQWLVKPRTPVLREGVEPRMVLDEEPIHEWADSGSSVSSASTWLGGDVDESWTVPEHILGSLPLISASKTPSSKPQNSSPPTRRVIPTRPVISEHPQSYTNSRKRCAFFPSGRTTRRS